MVSKHYENRRCEREKFIDEYLGGDGKVIDSFVVDKGHKDGVERHDITSHGIIVVYNLLSGKLVTKLIAREGQLKRYYYTCSKNPPLWLINLCRRHEDLGYNQL